MGCFVYIFLGSCKDVANGPTAIASLLVARAAKGIWQRAVFLAFVTGLVEIAMCIMGLGFFLNFVSGPVNSAFTSAASIMILTTMFGDVIGINASLRGTFVDMWSTIFDNIHKISWNDTLMGVSCLIILLLMRSMVNFRIGPNGTSLTSKWQKCVNNTIWLICTARNAILVVATACISHVLCTSGQGELRVVGNVPGGMPNLSFPPFSVPKVINETTGEIVQAGESFTEMIHDMGFSIIVIPLIALLENMSICKAFGK